jgi:hypothetical protein
MVIRRHLASWYPYANAQMRPPRPRVKNPSLTWPDVHRVLAPAAPIRTMAAGCPNDELSG